ncbi:alpha/beta hydrolase [Kribbella capetownensis]|uniref:Alpha/beta hydrolase n=1 Tax=Kribbella capetownensis TaxID=1572659 RepID=A0A4R0K4A5_9ACTN|nr:alpha/beta hydrolase [Kribbella capetownensis]TCC52618.1 alpha/beta hydrolase [Kribbella capetownensis]
MPETDLTLLPDIQYASPDGIPLCLDVLMPKRLPNPTPAVLRIDGCPAWGPGDRSSAMLPFVNPALAQAGFLTVALSVRHSGQATFPAQLHDVQAAVSWLRSNPLDLPVDTDHIGIWGQSAGGHLAALAGLVPGSDVQAVVTISGPSDLLQPGGAMQIDRPSPVTALVGGDVSTHAEQLRAASPIAQVTADAPPFLIIHGTRDETVPYEQSERLHRALLDAGAAADLIAVDGGHHNLRPDPNARYEGRTWYDVAGEATRFFQYYLASATKCMGSPKPRSVMPAV